MIRVADYVADFVYQQGVKEVFFVSGGGMMFLSDGLAMHPKLKAICNHHEQACAMAAVSYARYNQNLGVAYLTTGCGGSNGVTGVLEAWQDNIPSLFISGQSKRKETVRNSGLGLRQVGVQEADIVGIVDSITKYAVMVNDPLEIAYHLEKAVWLARSGRPGPVWVDIPLDVQGAVVDEKAMKHFSEDEKRQLPKKIGFKEEPTKGEIDQVLALLAAAKRPMIIAGQGVRLSGAISEFRTFVERTGTPVVASRLGIDLLPSDHPLFIGRIGNKGDRAGNFAVQNADFVLAIGSRLSVSSTGHEYDKFAREATIAVVDIDPIEHQKKTVRIDHFINSDAKKFLEQLLKASFVKKDDRGAWQETCLKWKKMWPACLPEYGKQTGKVNMYHFTDQLTRQMKDDAVVVSDAGSAFYVVSQAVQIRDRQRYVTSAAQADMGNTLPSTIGVCFANGKKEVLGITGDGSFQMNIQELQTIAHYKLPIKLFVWNNDGYLSIRASQAKFFENRFIGTDEKSGVSFPSIQKIADAYGLPYFRMSENQNVAKDVQEIFKQQGPLLIEVMCIRDQEVVPTVSSLKRPDGTMVSKPIEDMYPFLDREVFRQNMIVKPLAE